MGESDKKHKPHVIAEAGLTTSLPEPATKEVLTSKSNIVQDENLPPIPALRRSTRDRSTAVQKIIQIHDAILHPNYIYFETRITADKGRGVFVLRPFVKDEFLLPYIGELISEKEGFQREKRMTSDQGCFLFFLIHNGIPLCIDATTEDGNLGRLLNHSRTNRNCVPKRMIINERPYIYFIAARDINEGEELLYDYGEHRPDVLTELPFLKL